MKTLLIALGALAAAGFLAYFGWALFNHWGLNDLSPYEQAKWDGVFTHTDENGSPVTRTGAVLYFDVYDTRVAEGPMNVLEVDEKFFVTQQNDFRDARSVELYAVVVRKPDRSLDIFRQSDQARREKEGLETFSNLSEHILQNAIKDMTVERERELMKGLSN